jgi:hypothetical protein
MQPQTPTDFLPIATVTVGMRVIDAEGAEAGKVTAVQLPGTDVRPDVEAGTAESLMGAGYARVDGTGFLSNDTYLGGDQIHETTDGVVHLRVPREELHRAAS